MTFQVAIVGSGPAGFYAAEALLQSDLPIKVDLIDRLPVPFGLVRHGIAPDHQRLKAVSAQFERIAEDSRFTFIGNLEVGRDVSLADLKAAYHGVILATGAIRDTQLGIPGEEMPGSVSATDLVGWYNGHPDFQHRTFDFSQSAAVVIGNGNVALDVCRILLKSVQELESSDICEHALAALAKSRITDVYLVGRRGPAQAKFTSKELREFGDLALADPMIDAADLDLNDASLEDARGLAGTAQAKNMDILNGFSTKPSGDKPKRLHFRFQRAPVSIDGSDRVESIRFAKLRLEGPAQAQRGVETGEFETLDAGLIIRSVGYRGHAVPGAPFDDQRGIIPHLGGRVIDNSAMVVRGLYTAGWIKRGPSGVVGTNRACAIDTVESLLKDLQEKPPHIPAGRRERLRDRFRELVDFEGWRRIDARERSIGQARAKPREKFTAVSQMVEASAPATKPSITINTPARLIGSRNGVKQHARY